MNKLEVSHLKKTYPNGVTAINDISLTLVNGTFGLLGPNGAGKSSFMRTIAGLQSPDSGTIRFNGEDVLKDPQAIQRWLGYLPQEFGVYPRISAMMLLDHLAVLKGVTGKKHRKEQILALLEQTNLLEHRNKSVSTFSGGMRQRFGIAQALLGSPRIIIVDEPTAGLDPEERNRFNNLLSAIGENIIVILSTHIVEDVRDLCTSMAIVANGRLLTMGNPSILIGGLEGKIWQKEITKESLSWYQEKMGVISSRLNGGKLNVHVFAECDPGNGFQLAAPGLEDVYFYTLLHQHHNDRVYA